jgi:hypothetical protein
LGKKAQHKMIFSFPQLVGLGVEGLGQTVSFMQF